MGISSDGQICYGISFDEDYEFPWNGEWDGEADDIDSWWLFEVCKYKNPFELFDDDGEWIGGIEATKEQRDAYFAPRRAFKKAHPLPVELVWHCSYEYPMYILATPGSVLTASRGYPKAIESLEARPSEVAALMAFCKEYNLEGDGPKWWLSSMCG